MILASLFTPWPFFPSRDVSLSPLVDAVDDEVDELVDAEEDARTLSLIPSALLKSVS